MAPSHSSVVTLSDARSRLPSILRAFSENPAAASPVVIGAHRKPTAVLIPVEQFGRRGDKHGADNEAVRAILHRKRDLIHRLAQMHNIVRVMVFGSVARGDDDEQSDVDLLIAPSSDMSYFDMAEFASDVEAIVRRRVDVVSERALNRDLDRQIFAEAEEL